MTLSLVLSAHAVPLAPVIPTGTLRVREETGFSVPDADVGALEQTLVQHFSQRITAGGPVDGRLAWTTTLEALQVQEGTSDDPRMQLDTRVRPPESEEERALAAALGHSWEVVARDGEVTVQVDLAPVRRRLEQAGFDGPLLDLALSGYSPEALALQGRRALLDLPAGDRVVGESWAETAPGPAGEAPLTWTWTVASLDAGVAVLEAEASAARIGPVVDLRCTQSYRVRVGGLPQARDIECVGQNEALGAPQQMWMRWRWEPVP